MNFVTKRHTAQVEEYFRIHLGQGVEIGVGLWGHVRMTPHRNSPNQPNEHVVL